MVEFKHVTKIYHIDSGPVYAVHNLSFSIKKGTILGLLGPNGAGKTTTIKMISTLLEPTSGSITVCGLNTSKNPGLVRKKIGVVLGHKMIYHRLTGKANLRYYGALYGVNDIDTRINELARLFNLEKRIDDLVETYSTGMRAKLALMRGLIHNPEVLLLDEPTLGLDPEMAAKLRSKILQFKEEKRTIILCTHHLQDAEQICDNIIILNKGKIITYDTPTHLRQKEHMGRKLMVYFKNKKQIENLVKTHNLKIYHDINGIHIRIVIDSIEDLTLWTKRLTEYGFNKNKFFIEEPTFESIYLSRTKQVGKEKN